MCSRRTRKRSRGGSRRTTRTASTASATGRPSTGTRCSKAYSRASSARNRRRPRAATTLCTSAWSREAPSRTVGPCSTTAVATRAWAAEPHDRNRAARRSAVRSRAVGRQLRDIARLNALFGGTRAVVRELKSFFERRRAMGNRKRETWTLLDVGTGSGDIALAARAAARQLDIDLKAIGLELNPTAARIASAAGVPTIVADGSALPLGPRSVDVVVASQVLHHLPRPVAVRWIATLDRIA